MTCDLVSAAPFGSPVSAFLSLKPTLARYVTHITTQ